LKLKQRKENNIPESMLSGDQPARKRSKLVLPEPQISDQVCRLIYVACGKLTLALILQELQQVVKLGRASEIAREVAAEGSNDNNATDSLLADYAITPPHASAARTPAPQTDRYILHQIVCYLIPY